MVSKVRQKYMEKLYRGQKNSILGLESGVKGGRPLAPSKPASVLTGRLKTQYLNQPIHQCNNNIPTPWIRTFQ